MAENQEEQNLQEQVSSLRGLVLTVLKETIKTSHTLDGNFEVLKKQIKDLETKVEELAKETGKDFTTVGGKLDNIQNEISKIEKVSRYTEEFENLLKIS